MSAYLFIFALEVLLVIMRDEEIKGIALEDKVLRIAAFAEDLTSFLHLSWSFENLSTLLVKLGKINVPS